MGYQSIYNQLRANGLTEAGALGMLGNFECESNCIPYRLQGDYSYPYNASRQYTDDVDSGRIGKQQFSRDSKGYGLAQWTYYSRKEDLWDFWKARGGSIGDEHLQVEFTIAELVEDFPSLLDFLRSSNDLYECTKKICYQFENPAIKNVDQRFAAAKRIQNEINLDPQPVPPEPSPEPTPEPEPQDHSLDLRTIDKNCSGFNEVFLLQSALLCRKYISTTPTDVFGSWLEEIVKQFQKDAFPNQPSEWDGVVGPMTWDKLLDRG